LGKGFRLKPTCEGVSSASLVVSGILAESYLRSSRDEHLSRRSHFSKTRLLSNIMTVLVEEGV
jgi:hypothetical protein